ncbi:hypothetical protein UA18_02911 [Burkholderia multivorans]|uniref:Uncharacterized protein n=1 Tax=Burkholderia multivorans TaxID=87883 RepID=A0ABD7LKJ6_9BURK|nr:hypothetical protein UA17_00103 [Burkholderia multivorans]SAK22210.1 hypothetical protein UA18_02911 [Burkholderia multivorans]
MAALAARRSPRAAGRAPLAARHDRRVKGAHARERVTAARAASV